MSVSLRDRLSALYSHLENRTFSTYWQSRAREVLPRLDLRPDVDALELGCGAGLWSSFVAPRVETLTALDVDRGEIVAARQWRSPRVPYRPVTHVRFVVGDALALPFIDESFDLVYAVDVIEHVPDDQRAAQEITRVLRPGGRAVLTSVRRDRPSYIRKMVWSTHKREYLPGELSALFDGTGLNLREEFAFYRGPALFAREIETALQGTWAGRAPVLSLAIKAPISLLSRLERVAPIGRPSGIGVLVERARDRTAPE